MYIGFKWAKLFLNRQKTISTRIASNLAKNRASSLNKFSLTHFYDFLEKKVNFYLLITVDSRIMIHEF